MAAPVLWLAIYLTVGALVLCACYNSSACLLRARMERNTRITSMLSSLFSSKTIHHPSVPPTGAPTKAAVRR